MTTHDKVTFGENCTLYCGDAFEILPTLEDGSIDAVISDMPYSSSFGRCTACDWDKPIPLEQFWQLMETKTKPEANIALFCNMKLAYDLIGTKKEWFRYDLIWAKNNRVGFLNANLQPLKSHELILLFGRPGFRESSVYNPIKLPGGRPFVKKTRKRKQSVYPPQEPHTTVSDGGIYPNSILAFDNDRGGNKTELCFHPTMKPLYLMGWLLMLYTQENGIVLDPFMGSGTTGVATMKLSRGNFIGIERERKYFDIACQRIEEVMSRKKAG